MISIAGLASLGCDDNNFGGSSLLEGLTATLSLNTASAFASDTGGNRPTTAGVPPERLNCCSRLADETLHH